MSLEIAITQRVTEIFEEIIFIHSPSRRELAMHQYLVNFLGNLGLSLYEDHHQEKYGGNSPVLIAKLEGSIPGEGVTFSAHTDVIEPNQNLHLIKEDNIWRTDGTTTLGADDKAGVAAILTMVEYLIQNQIPHCDIYLIFTPSEEIGMFGAQFIDWEAIPESMKPAKQMLVLDNAGSANRIAYQAPAYYSWQAKIFGQKAHAGIEPEKGISAIQLASQIISRLPLLRIDEETTANIGAIHTESPFNVVPDLCEFAGELRSHNQNKAEEILANYEQIMWEIAGPDAFEFLWECEYPALRSQDEFKLLNEIIQVYGQIGVRAEGQIIGGGSDANFFAGQGFNAVILGVGMQAMHTCQEYLEVDQMVLTTLAILKYVSKK